MSKMTWINLSSIMLLLTTLSSAVSDELTEDEHYLTLNGNSIYYEIQGQGEPLLLLHGGLSHSGAWHQQVAALKPHFQLILMDSRGHGRSSLNAEQISYAAMADDVIGLLNALKIKRTHLLGWSDGGIIGLEIAIRAPERLGKLIAFGTNYHQAGVRADLAENKRFGEYFAACAKDYQALSPTPQHWQKFLDNIMTMWTSEPNFSVEELRGIRSEVLVLAGAQEEAIKITHVESMAQLIEQSTLTLIPETGHFAHWDKPDEFNTIVLDFLRQ